MRLGKHDGRVEAIPRKRCTEDKLPAKDERGATLLATWLAASECTEWGKSWLLLVGNGEMDS